MRRSYWLTLIFAGLLTSQGRAQDLRFLALGGIGQAKVQSASATRASRIESPGGFSIAVDHYLSGPYFIYAEHMRSLGAGGTSVGLTGLGFKFYPWVNPLYVKNLKPISGRSAISIQGYLPYFGMSLGFDQVSMLGNAGTDDVLAVGTYAAAKAGIEMPFAESWGLIVECNYANSITGSGALQAMNILFGGYFRF